MRRWRSQTLIVSVVVLRTASATTMYGRSQRTRMKSAGWCQLSLRRIRRPSPGSPQRTQRSGRTASRIATSVPPSRQIAPPGGGSVAPQRGHEGT